MLDAMIASACQRWLNRCIGRSAAARTQAARLAGKRFAIVVQGAGQRIDLVGRGGALDVEVKRRGDETADALLEGTPLDLLRLAGAGSDALGRLQETRAQLSGDVHVAEAFVELLRLAQPDIEEELAGWIGDISAHEIGRFGRGAVRFCRDSAAAVATDLGEYLQEERAVLAAAPLARGFSSDVDRLRDAVERLEQRVDRLERARTGRS